MLIIGSVAANLWGLLDREIGKDLDVIMTYDQFQLYLKDVSVKPFLKACYPIDDSHFVLKYESGKIEEVEIAWPGTSAEMLIARYPGMEKPEEYNTWQYAYPNELYAIKMSHRYKKNSPHFLKTMRDIQTMRAFGCEITEDLQDFYALRQKESYAYSHPKLDQSKEGFFSGDGVRYVYDHDSIHEAVALQQTTEWGQPCPDGIVGCLVNHGKKVMIPAYTHYIRDGAEVMTSKEKFFACDEKIRLYGVYEESCVLALERSQIPYEFKPDPRKSFETALMKVCTSITSGWFREYAWENYDKVLDMYQAFGENDYIERFNRNRHLLRPFES